VASSQVLLIIVSFSESKISMQNFVNFDRRISALLPCLDLTSSSSVTVLVRHFSLHIYVTPLGLINLQHITSVLLILNLTSVLLILNLPNIREWPCSSY
jgi:hypothetical protein